MLLLLLLLNDEKTVDEYHLGNFTIDTNAEGCVGFSDWFMHVLPTEMMQLITTQITSFTFSEIMELGSKTKFI